MQILNCVFHKKQRIQDFVFQMQRQISTISQIFYNLLKKTYFRTTPDHLLLDRSPNIGPLISRWKLDTFKNWCNKSFRTSKILTLLYQQLSNLLISQRWYMSGPRLGALSNTIVWQICTVCSETGGSSSIANAVWSSGHGNHLHASTSLFQNSRLQSGLVKQKFHKSAA